MLYNFRGKILNGKLWFYGNYMHTSDGEHLIGYMYYSSCPESDDFNFHEVDPKTIGQYIGINDNEENELYPGDILRNDSMSTKVIKWIPEECRFMMANTADLKNEKYQDIWMSIKKKYIQEFGFIRIGNIFDNPELLEDK